MPDKKNSQQARRRRRRYLSLEKNTRVSKNIPWRKLFIIGLCVSVLTVVAMLTYRWVGYRNREKRRLEWAKSAIEDVSVFVNDPALVEAELKPLRRSIGNHDLRFPEFYSERLIVTADGKWLAYKQTCSKGELGIRDLFVGYSSDGRWYYSSCHFCVNMIAFGMGQEYQPGSMDDLLSDWAFVEFDGNPQGCMEATAVLPDIEAIQRKFDSAMDRRRGLTKSSHKD